MGQPRFTVAAIFLHLIELRVSWLGKDIHLIAANRHECTINLMCNYIITSVCFTTGTVTTVPGLIKIAFYVQTPGIAVNLRFSTG